MGGETSQEGRVEFCFGGFWGAVCDNGWDSRDAIVVCRQLGLPLIGMAHCCDLKLYAFVTVVQCHIHLYFSHSETFAVARAFFGREVGPSFLTSVGCHGTESRLDDCSYRVVGNNYCGHNRGAGVICSGT